MSEQGIPLRDYLAAQALHGLMMRHDEPGYSDIGAALEAYTIADYMMEVRSWRLTYPSDIDRALKNAGYVREETTRDARPAVSE